MGEEIDKENYKVYKHTLSMSVSGKQNDMVYIGITRKKNVKQRWLNGRGYDYNLHFSRAIKKYGWDNFKHEVLFEGLSKEDAERKEIDLIAYYCSTDPNKGYNIELGGNSVGKVFERTKQLISQKNKGRVHTEETRKKMSEGHLGIKKSDVFKEKLSDIKSIPVICIETEEIYKSAYEAHDILGIDNSTISKCCRGINKSAGGFHWMFIDDYSKEAAKEILEKTSNNNHRSVMCIETQKVYDTITAAANDIGTSVPEISACCKGRLMSAGGKRWLYLEDVTKEKIEELLAYDISYGKPKRVFCKELNKVFNNAKEAGLFTGVISSNITACCTGKVKSAGKLDDGTRLHWEYYKGVA